MAIERQFQPDEWFPRNKKGTCYGGGPSSTSDIIERRIAENMQRRIEKDWDQVHDIFQNYARALTKFMTFEEAETRANKAFQRICFTCSGRLRFKGKMVYATGTWHVPRPNNPEYLSIKRFIQVDRGEVSDFAICGRCLVLLRKTRLAEHELKCQGPHRGSVGLKVPSGKM